MSLRPGQRLELEVSALAAGGAGVAHSSGRVVFVPFSAPGDRVRVRVEQVRKRFARATIEEILAPGESRREPACPFFSRCGGCSWQHVEDGAQLRARESILREALRRIGGLRELPTIQRLPSPDALGYRARARVRCEGGRVGFRRHGSHRVIDVDHCRILDPETSSELERLRRSPPASGRDVEIRGFGFQLEVGGRSLQVGPEAFVQPNGLLWDAWAERVADACGHGELALDLYAGVGFYSVALEERFRRVIAVERGPAALDAARNLRGQVVHAAVEDWLPGVVDQLWPDLILLNPPRGGCEASVIDALRSLAPARLVYVSCEPSTLARDLARLGPAHRITELTLLDALPQTHHVESVVVLSR